MRLKSFLQFFTQAWRKHRPIRRKHATRRHARLLVEMLEKRELLAGDVPTILASGVLPIDGSTTLDGTPALRVQYSETMTTSALLPANYILLNSSGTAIPINALAFNNGAIAGAAVNSVVDVTYNTGNPLFVDTYTLFLRGDKVFDVDDGFAMTQPGQLVVANSGRNSVSILSMPGDGTLGAVSNYGVPGNSVRAANPTAVAMGDLDGDGVNDLVVANQGTNQLTAYLGKAGGGYQMVPDLILDLPDVPTSVILADLSGDGQPEIVSNYTGIIAGSPVAGVRVFLNTSTPGNFSMNTGTNYALDNANSQPGALAAGDIDGDGKLDVVVPILNAATDLGSGAANDFRVDILLGDGAGALASQTPIRVGDVAPTGLQTPSTVAVALLNLDQKPDIVVGGANGIVLFQNNSTAGNINFFVTPTFLTASTIVDVNTATVGAGSLVDVIGTTASGTVEVYQNNSTTVADGGSFLPALVFSVAGGTTVDSRLAVGDLNNDGKPDLAVTNGAATPGAGKLTVMKDTTIGGSISAATNPGLIVVTSKNNGLKTGQSIVITGAQGNTAANNTWTITQVTGNVAAADGSGSSDIVINSPGHGLSNGESITIAGNSFAAANGTFTVTVINANDFSLNGTGSLAGSGTSGTWTSNDRFSLNGSVANGNYIGGGFWAAIGNISSANGPGGALPVTIVSPANRLVTGNAVTIAGSAIAAIDNNTYTITTVTLSGTETSAGSASQPITITTSASHNLATGDTVTITGDSFAEANGTFVITVTGAATFTLNGTTGITGSGTGGAWACTTNRFTLNGTDGITGAGTGGTWTTAVNFFAVAGSPYETNTTPRGVVIGDTNDTAGSGLLSQYASSVFAFSSQYTTGSWAATQALGPPNVFTYGDDTSAWSPLNQDGPPNPEFLDLRYTTPVYATGVVVRETYNTGFVNKIDLIDTSDVYHTVFNGTDPNPVGSIANFAVSFPTTSYLVKGVKVYVNATHVTGNWEEIDSVQLLGSVGNSAGNDVINLDVVTANFSGNDFTLFLGQGDGTLQTGVNTPLTPTVTNRVAIADLNLDAVPDLVLINNNNNSSNTQVTVMPGIGGGNYGTPINYNVGNGLRSLNSLAIGDINGDGMPDIAFSDANIFDNTVGFLLNTLNANDPIAAGSFASSPTAPTVNVGRTPTQVVMADFNADAKLDLAVAHNGFGGPPSRRGVTVLLGNGDGSFLGGVEYDSDQGMTGIVVGDFNRDGRMDFAAVETTGGSANVWVNYGNGMGGFSAGQSFNTGITNPGAIQAADFNGDGYLDVIVGSTSNSLTNGGLAVLLNQLGTGFGAPLQTNALPGQGITSVITTDINRDGLADVIVAANPISSSISAATNAGPIVITSNGHGLKTGQQVFISGVGGNTAANGLWTITFVDSNRFSLVGSTGSGNYTGGGTWYILTDNVYVMTGLGDGTFRLPTPYLAGVQGGPVGTPSYLAATSSGLLRVTTFISGGKTISTDLVVNGDFEERDLSGEQGNLLGWQTFDLNTSPGGSFGKWLPQTGSTSPLSGSPASPSGFFSAMLDQGHQVPYDPVFFGPYTNPNAAATYSGSHALYQDFTIPASATKATLSLDLSIDNTFSGTYSDTTVNSSLDYRTPAANQQVRVDIMRPTSPILSVSTTLYSSGTILTATETGGGTPIVITTAAPHNLATGALVIISGVSGFAEANGTFTVTVIDATHFSLNGTKDSGSGTGGTWGVAGDILRNEFITSPTTLSTFSGNVEDLDLTAFAGQTVRLRIAAANNRGLLVVGVDDVNLTVEFDDTIAPTLTALNVSNPSFVSAGIPHTNDPTFVGTIADNGGLAAIAYVEFDPNNDGFGGPDDFKVTKWDARGNFRFTLPNAAAGLDTIGVQVVDRAANKTPTTFTFFMQSNSVTEWEAVGPQGIDVTGQGVDYTTVSGRVTVTLPDLNDPLGNSYFVGSANGGIWKTTNGGTSWISVTNSVTDGSGNPVPVPVGGMAQSRSSPNVLYAATGVGDRGLDSRPGIGVLKSTDGGNTWVLIGDSGTVLTGARVVKVIVDSNTPNTAYVGVASGGSAGPGVYKTTDGGLTWANVLNPASMGLSAGLLLDSVTDLIIDPANSNRLLVGLGDIGLVAASTTTGVWASANQGASWRLIQGGDNPSIPNNRLPNDPVNNNHLGRITLAIGQGRTGNEGYVYVLISTPPPTGAANTPPNVDFGTFAGLYRTKDNMLNFTKVMLKEDLGPVSATILHNFVDINLFSHDAANAGAMTVDPINPNVVYIGGSNRWARTNDPLPNHLLIRVDTGNMSDTTAGLGNNGDDIYKFQAAAFQSNKYDPSPGPAADNYKGEGVYWYDLAQDESNTTGNLDSLPPAITSLSVDAQGRLLVGTVGGIWRGVGLGFGYDFTSGGSGIFGGGFGPDFSAPAMTFTSINNNLQIADMTSVAIDPFNRGVYYTTQIDTGVAGSSAPLVWVSQGLTGPTVNGVNLGIPSAGSVLTSSPAPTFIGNITGVTGAGVSPIVVTATSTSNPANHGLNTGDKVVIGSVQGNTAANGTFTVTVIDATHFSLDGSTGNGNYVGGGNYGSPAPAGTPVNLYRIWQYANQLALQPETSNDNGANWGGLGSTGISINNPAGTFPAFAVNPTPILQSGLYQTALAFGANVIYATDTSATVWDPISGVLFPNTKISALAFAPSDPLGQTLYAATYNVGGSSGNGRLFYTSNKGGDGWPERSVSTGGAPFVNLPVDLPDTYIRSIAVDPFNANEVFVMYGGTGTTDHVYRSLDAGQNWTDISVLATSGLPNVPAYAMVIDRTPNLGAPTGKLYLATEVGVFYSLNDGDTWTRLGQGMPNVPVVDLKFDAGLKVLAGATLGRGIFTINTAAISFIPNLAIDEDTTSNPIPFTVNDPGGISYSLTATSDNDFLIQDSSIVLGGSGQDRTIQFTPVLNANTPNNGVANITVTVTSGSFTYSQVFQVTVNAVNDLPTISPIPTQLTLKNQAVPTINFTIGDVETQATALTVTAASNNTTLVPNLSANLTLGGSGPNRTLTITPANNQVGSAVITVTVTDANFGITNLSFNLLVTDAVTLPFSDDFNRPDSTIFLGPGWNINTGSVPLTNQKAAFAGGLSIISLNQLSTTDIAVQADVSVGAGQNLGLTARYNGGLTNMYWGAIIANATGTAFTADIWRNLNGAWTQLVSKPVPNGIGGAGTLRFEVANTSLKLFYGATAGSMTLVAFANDSGLTGPGSAGLRTTTGNVTADNFLATAINLATPALPFTDPFSQTDGTQLSNNWINQAGGNFTVTGNAVVANVGATVSLATIAGLNLTNQYAQADISVGSSSAGVVTRYSGSGYYYALVFADGADYYVDILRFTAGVGFAEVTSAANGGPAGLPGAKKVTSVGAAGTLRLEAVGSSLKAFYGPNVGNMALVNFGYDSMWGSGSTGMRAFAGIGIDNFMTDAIALTTPSPLPFTEDFSTAVNGDQVTRNWQDQAGNFNVTGGMLVGAAPGINVATLNGLIPDASAQAEIVVDPAANQEAGVLVRASASGYYYGQIASTGSGYVANIWRFNSPTATSGTRLAGPFPVVPSGNPFDTVRLEAAGPSLKLFYNDSLVAFAFDTTGAAPFTTGTTGVRASKGATTSIDTFIADAITLTTPGSLPFTDNFSTPVNTSQLNRNWTERQGNFTINGVDQLHASGTGLNIATVNGLSFADETAQVEVVTGTANQNVSLILRYQSNGAYYVGGIVRSGPTTFTPYILRNTGAGFVALASTTTVPGALLNETGTMRFEIAGGTLKLFWDDVLVAFGYDGGLTAPGLPGLRVSSGVILDEFVADQIVQTTPSLPFNEGFGSPVPGNQLSRDWTERMGNFTDNGTDLMASAAGLSIATVNGLSFADEFAEVQITTGTANQNVSLVLRYQSNGAYYVAGIVRSGTTFTPYMLRNTGAGFVAITSSTTVPGVLLSDTGTLRFEIAGGALKLFFNGELAAYGYDSALTAPGLPGLRVSSGVTLDNFVADQIVQTTPSSLPFNDDFSAPVNGNQLSRNWDEQLGNFAIDGSQQAVANDASFNIATVHGVSLTDATVQTEVILGGNQHGGVVARYQADGTFYVGLVLANAAGDSLTPYIFTNKGGFQQLNPASTPAIAITAGSPHTLRFEVAGTSLKLFVDNVLATYAYDNRIMAAGKVGIRASKNAALANFQADQITLNNPASLPFADNFDQTAGTSLSSTWTERQGLFSEDVSGLSMKAVDPSVISIATVNGPLANSSSQLDVAFPGTGTHIAGLVARFDAATNSFYVGLIQSTGGSLTAYLFKKVNGTFTLLTSAPLAASLTGTVRLDVVGGNIKLLYTPTGGNLMLAAFANDTSITAAGLSGMYVGPNDTVDNFVLDAVNLTTPALPFTDPFTGSNGTQLSRNWLDRIGNYSVASDKIVGSASNNLATVNGLALGAVDVSADVNVGVNQYAGVVTRYQANGSFYTGIIVSNGPGAGFTAYLFRYNALTNSYTQLAATNGPTGPVTGTTGFGVGPIVITSANHGLVSGQQVTIAGVQGNTAANGSFTVTVVDANRFSLNGTTGNGNYAGGGAWTRPIVGAGTLTLRAQGSSLKLFYAGSLIAYVYDTTYATGTTGVRSSAGATLDNFNTTALNIPTSQPSPFTETFAVNPPTQQLSTNWQERTGNFSVAGGPAVGLAAFNLATVNGINTANADLSAVVNLAAQGQYAILAARYTTAAAGDTYYYAKIENVGASGYAVGIYKVVNGVTTLLTAPNLFVASFTSGMRFLIVNGNLNLYLDGSALPAVNISDGSITGAGGIGFGVNATTRVNSFTAS